MCGWQYLVAIQISCSNIKSTCLMLICIKHCDYPASYASVRRMHSMDNLFFRFPEEPFQQKQHQETTWCFCWFQKQSATQKSCSHTRQTIFDKLLAIFTPHLFLGQLWRHPDIFLRNPSRWAQIKGNQMELLSYNPYKGPYELVTGDYNPCKWKSFHPTFRWVFWAPLD